MNTNRVGMALWLLTGKRLPDRVQWAVRSGFESLALLQLHMRYDAAERREAAAAIREAGLALTYHGNVHENLTAAGDLDIDFVSRMCDDVIWWHENAGPVAACASDPLHRNNVFDLDSSVRLMSIFNEKFGARGIRYGIENGFGGEQRFQSIADMTNFGRHAMPTQPGLLFDTGHAHIHLKGATGETLAQYVRAIPLPILEVHVSDNHGERDEHLPLGSGTFDMTTLCRTLREIGYAGPITVEVCPNILVKHYCSDIDNESQTDALLRTRDAIKTALAAR